jgi:MIZ/SP-RING zinc finger
MLYYCLSFMLTYAALCSHRSRHDATITSLTHCYALDINVCRSFVQHDALCSFFLRAIRLPCALLLYLMYCCSCCYCYCYCCYDADELLATSTRLSLRCPLGLVPITVPGRGARCTHLQCFDLTTFLSFNEKNRCVRACCIHACSMLCTIYIITSVYALEHC